MIRKETLERLTSAQKDSINVANALYALKTLTLLPVLCSDHVDLTGLANGLSSLFELMEKTIGGVTAELSEVEDDLQKMGKEA